MSGTYHLGYYSAVPLCGRSKLFVILTMFSMTLHVCQCERYSSFSDRVYQGTIKDPLTKLFRFGPRDTIAGLRESRSTRRRTSAAAMSQLFRAIMRESHGQRSEDGMYYVSEDRKKRPTSKSYGLLGIDNLDFTATILDRARARGRLPADTEWEIAKQMSKQISTQPSPSRPRPLSMAMSVTDLRRMLDMFNAG